MAWSRGWWVVTVCGGCVANPVFGVRETSDETSGTAATSGPATITGAAETGTMTTTSTTADVTTASVTSTGDSDGTSGGSTTEPVDDCGLLCGEPLGCCAANEECVVGGCAGTCASGVRCGEEEACCAADQACIEGACAGLGEVCMGDVDCGVDEFCDPAANKCLPRPEPAPTCEVVPGGALAAQLVWSFEKDEVINVPMVADLTGDGVPDVVINTTRAEGNALYEVGEVVCLDGASGKELWRVGNDPNDPDDPQFGAHGFATLALADVDMDKLPDVVYAGRATNLKSAIIAVRGLDGALLWRSHDKQQNIVTMTVQHGAVAVANLDDDPQAEVAVGGTILDHDGMVMDDKGSLKGSPSKKNMPAMLLYSGGLPVFADLSGDGYPELITGNEAWTIEWMLTDPPTAKLQMSWKDNSGFKGDGWPAVADFDGDGSPEVLLIGYPEIKLLDAGGELWCGVDPSEAKCMMNQNLRTQPVSLADNYIGGPAVVADFDGDERPEFALSIGDSVVVYDVKREGEVVVQPDGDAIPPAGAIFRKWQTAVQDTSSASVGASAFDFDGDGAAELLFQDECFARVFDGASGQELLKIENSSATIHEYPVVADVDADGQAELILVANLSDGDANATCGPGYQPRKGVFVYRAAGGRWAPTQRVWTEHSHHVTNAVAGGLVPMQEETHWTLPDRNNFREAPHGPVLTNAPDLVAALGVVTTGCPATLTLRAAVFNHGSLGVPAGIEVAFYAGPEPGEAVGAGQTNAAILPGGYVFVEVEVAAPAGEQSYRVVIDPGDAVEECVEENNHVGVTGVVCP